MAIVRPKEAYHERATKEMEEHLLTPEWNLRQKIALSCRILADEGHESALAGQITARGEKPGTYWMLGFGLGFDEAQASNIVLCDDDLNLLEGDGMVNPSNRFHLWIYRHRPHVNAIVHTHPPYI
jgi:L-fuculose-phosphate aldolase